MDPIKQALERARKAQEQGSDVNGSVGSGASQGLPSEPAGAEMTSGTREQPAPQRSQTSGRSGPSSAREGDDQVIDRTRTPVVTLDPFHLTQSRIASFDAEDAMSAPFDMLRTRVMQAMAAREWRTLGVLSADPGEGKTVTAINLALSIAKLPNQTALLLDLDFRQPGLLQTLGHYPEYCIDDWLRNQCEFSDVLFSPMTARLAVAGVRSAIANPAETLSATRVTRLIDELRSRYSDRIIVVDMPSVLLSDDALTLIPRIDAFLMVVASGQTTAARARECVQLLPADRVVGSVLNKSIR